MRGLGFISLALTVAAPLSALAQTDAADPAVVDAIAVYKWGEQRQNAQPLKDYQSTATVGLKAYTIKSGDTLSEIVEENGFRYEPNAVQVIKALNSRELNPGQIYPGQQVLIPYVQDASAGLYLLDSNVATKTAIKTRMDATASRFEIADWHTPEAEARYNAVLKTAYPTADAGFPVNNIPSTDRISLSTKLWAQTGFAGDALTLAGIDSGYKLYEQIRLKTPDAWSAAEINYVGYFAKAFESTARAAYSMSLPPVEALIETKRDGVIINDVEICYDNAIWYYLFQAEAATENAQPDWDCGLHRFGSLSSPARDHFGTSTSIVIWAWLDGKRASDFRILDVVPHEIGGSVQITVALYGDGL